MNLQMKDLEHVLKLAHLQIEDNEKIEYLDQLQHILQHMESMNKLDLSAVEPTSYANKQATLLREDIVKPQADLLLEQNAPVWESNCFMVPKILDE
jgi:aspartyl-tRNA(Asn)/glutamyl-tRNA(Gln) amidotransferase subunit C